MLDVWIKRDSRRGRLQSWDLHSVEINCWAHYLICSLQQMVTHGYHYYLCIFNARKHFSKVNRRACLCLCYFDF